MSTNEEVTIREVERSDLEHFYEQQLDPEANRMAAFVAVNPSDRVAFDAHWDKILRDRENTNRAVIVDGVVAGHIASFPQGGNREVTYWLGRDFWGRGIATQALALMLRLEVHRPLMARIATDNLGSRKVLQRCGFRIVGEDKGFANGRGKVTDEYILRLDLGRLEG